MGEVTEGAEGDGEDFEMTSVTWRRRVRDSCRQRSDVANNCSHAPSDRSERTGAGIGWLVGSKEVRACAFIVRHFSS